MKKILLLGVFLFIAIISFSQTKRIAHRSHSGKDNSFNIAAGMDNFGLPVPDSIKTKNKTNSKNNSSKKDSLPPLPVKDSLKTIPPTSFYNDSHYFQEQLAFALLAARKIFNL
jgi:hypothetical protein